MRPSMFLLTDNSPQLYSAHTSTWSRLYVLFQEMELRTVDIQMYSNVKALITKSESNEGAKIIYIVRMG
jgi:hypothetical protein